MKPKILSSKKALSEFLLDIWSYIIFATTIFLFLVLFKLQSITTVHRALSGLNDIPSSQSNLINFLRTPVNLEDKQTDMAGLVRLWQFDPEKYKAQLETASIEILNKMEYEYVDIRTNNPAIRGFELTIYKSKDTIVENNLASFNSKTFYSGSCSSGQSYTETKASDCMNLAEQIIPISQDSVVYVALRESSTPK